MIFILFCTIALIIVLILRTSLTGEGRRRAVGHICGVEAVVALCLLTSCANPGSGPDGGPYDETPPTVVGMTLPQQAGKAGKRGTKVSIRFSEAVKLDNAQEKVVVSPPQIEQPEISVVGRNVTVQLLDTLRPNTTYTIDFADAISDATEGNPLGRFTYIFSTGEKTDTMEVSGHVLNAEDLEPLKGVLVGLYPAGSPDSLFRTQPMARVGRTDGNGRFSIKGVAEGEYRVVCLEDKDQDFKFSMKGERIGWLRDVIKPSSFPDIRYDTCWRDTVRWDSIRTVRYTHYTPDDLVLLGFIEGGQPRHRLKENRQDPDRLNFFFTAPSDSAPRLTPLNFDASSLRLEHNPGYDTLTYWIGDTAVVNTDTLRLLLTYDESDDSTGLRALTTDTLELLPRVSLERRQKQQDAEHEKWLKQLEKRHKRGDYSEETPPLTFLRTECKVAKTITPIDNISLTFSEPLDSLALSGVHLLLGDDSIQTESPYELLPLKGRLRSYELRAEWRPEQQYVLRLDSATAQGMLGHHNRKEEFQFSIARTEDFGTVFITIPDADPSTIVELLDNGGKPVRRETLVNGRRAEFYYVTPGAYYYRCFFDRNGDGRWTPGSYDQQQLAEEVFYSPVRLEVKANFDFDQTWTLAALPLTQQKPASMVKQKEDKKNNLTGHEKNIRRLEDKKKQN